MLTATEILNKSDVEVKAVSVPEWDTTVYIRAWGGKARGRFERVLNESTDSEKEEIRGLVAAMSLCDDHGALLFDSNKETVAKLSAKNGKALERIFLAAVELNKLDKKASKEIEGNLESAQS